MNKFSKKIIVPTVVISGIIGLYVDRRPEPHIELPLYPTGPIYRLAVSGFSDSTVSTSIISQSSVDLIMK